MDLLGGKDAGRKERKIFNLLDQSLSHKQTIGFNNCCKWVRLTEHGSYYLVSMHCRRGLMLVCCCACNSYQLAPTCQFQRLQGLSTSTHVLSLLDEYHFSHISQAICFHYYILSIDPNLWCTMIIDTEFVPWC